VPICRDVQVGIIIEVVGDGANRVTAIHKAMIDRIVSEIA
jgi:hypothetical protein